MYNSNIPTDQEVPSTAKLIKSTVLAAVVAVVILVAVVMPAEYGIDPTGVGQAIGLKKMGEIKTSLAKEIAEDELKESNTPEEASPKVKDPVVADKSEDGKTQLASHEMQVQLAPDEGTEVKVAMKEGDTVQYEWWTDGGKANFDVHGDSAALKINYHNYSKGSEQRTQGSLEAAFDGSHGWYWRNRTSETMTITLRTEGKYTDIKEMK